MTSRQLVWSAITISLVWVAAAGWFLTSRANPELTHISQIQFEQRLKDCRGRFSDRYDCKSALIRERDREELVTWSIWLAVVIGPPLANGIVVSIVGRRIDDRRRRAEMRARRRQREASELAAREQAIAEGRRRLEAVRNGMRPPRREDTSPENTRPAS